MRIWNTDPWVNVMIRLVRATSANMVAIVLIGFDSLWLSVPGYAVLVFALGYLLFWAQRWTSQSQLDWHNLENRNHE